MGKSWILIRTLILVSTMFFSWALPVNADRTPGHLDPGFDPGTGADNEVYAVAVQPDDKVLIGGYFLTVDGIARARIARLRADGSLDTTFDPGTGADDRVRALAVQPDGKVLIGGSFTTVGGATRNRIARLNADGTVDASFDPGTGPDNAVRCIVVQPDGRILVGGDFANVGGTTRNRIARLNANGILDTSFDPGAGASGTVYAMAVQPDGKVFIGGNFITIGGTTRNRIARLNANGTLDTSFDPGAGANNWISTLSLQADGKVLICGLFTTVNSTARNRIARLYNDGSLDASFDPGTGANAIVNCMAVRSDGKAIIAGAFTTFDGVALNRIAQLEADGSLDTSFTPDADDTVWDLVIQPDGKILMGGEFTTIDLTGRNRIARLYNDGSLDIGLDSSTGPNNQVEAIAVQPNGKIFIGGYFTEVDGTARNRIAKLNANGLVDTGFDPGTGANNSVSALALQEDGKLIIGGNFTIVNGSACSRIARFTTNGEFDSTFNPGAGADDRVRTVAIQDNGKVVIGGDFENVNGTARNRIARLNANGSLESDFGSGNGPDNGYVLTLVLHDGKVLIGGTFTTVGGVNRKYLARLNADGSLDTGFDTGAGPGGYVRAIAVQSDGKVLIGGSFTTVNGTARNRIARLNTNGSLDTSFDPGTGANNFVDAVAVQSDGKVLIGGAFTVVDGEVRNYIARLNADGSLDTIFDSSTGANDYVYDLKVQNDGMILIGGAFTGVNMRRCFRIGRLNGDHFICVRTGGAGCYGTIQAALTAAEDGDLIKVTQGNYVETPVKSTAGVAVISGGWNNTFTEQTGTTEMYAPQLTGGGSLRLLPSVRVKSP